MKTNIMEEWCDNEQLVVTKKGLQERAKKYMTCLYGYPGEGNDPDKWMERFGLLCGFIDEQFNPTIKQ